MMDDPKKIDDCYFYYYSTCYKGDNCHFRHEENALGCETVCASWKAGTCTNRRCQYRHMLLKKNRKAIPCFWETQPNGCRKPHCPFMHSNKQTLNDCNSKDSANLSGGTNQVTAGSTMSKNIPIETTSHLAEVSLRRPSANQIEKELNYASPSVDPLVVKFEEESDNELDIPSPCKFSPSVIGPSQKKSWVKTLEEIRLEKIQKLSAAFYSFTGGLDDNLHEDDGDDEEDVMMDVINEAIVVKKLGDFDQGAAAKQKSHSLVRSVSTKRKSSEDSLGFRVLTLDEIRQKRQKKNRVQEPDSTSESERPGRSSTPLSQIAGEDDKTSVTSEWNTVKYRRDSSDTIDIKSPLHRSTLATYVDASPKRKSPDVDVPQRQKPSEDVDILPHKSLPPSTDVSKKTPSPNVSQQTSADVSHKMNDVDAPQKKKPIRLKRSIRRDATDGQDLSSKRPKSSEEEQINLSLSSRSLDADLRNANLSETASNSGEMDTADILHGIDELLGT